MWTNRAFCRLKGGNKNCQAYIEFHLIFFIYIIFFSDSKFEDRLGYFGPFWLFSCFFFPFIVPSFFCVIFAARKGHRTVSDCNVN